MLRTIQQCGVMSAPAAGPRIGAYPLPAHRCSSTCQPAQTATSARVDRCRLYSTRTSTTVTAAAAAAHKAAVHPIDTDTAAATAEQIGPTATAAAKQQQQQQQQLAVAEAAETTPEQAVTPSAAAAACPRIQLTPLQSLADSFISSGALGEWRSDSLSVGYLSRQQQRQHKEQRQQRKQEYKHTGSMQHQRQQINRGSSSNGSNGQQIRERGLGHAHGTWQQQQPQRWWQLSAAKGKPRDLTQQIVIETHPRGLLSLLKVAHSSQPRILSIVHIAAVARRLVRLQRQRQQQDQEAMEELLLMMETWIAELLQDVTPAAAAAAGASMLDASSSSSSDTGFVRDRHSAVSAAAAAAKPSAEDAAGAARSLSTLMYSWGRLLQRQQWQQHRPSVEVMELLLEAFLWLLEQQQQQQTVPVKQQQQGSLVESQTLRQQQQQRSSALRNGTTGIHGSDDSSSGGVQDGSSSGSDLSHDMFRSLSNLTSGLCKLGYNCTNPYGSSSSSSKNTGFRRPQQQQRIERQQQYWSRLAALARDVADTAAAAAGSSSDGGGSRARDLSNLCYGFASAGYKDVVLWAGLAPHVITSVTDCTPQELSVTLWSYATARVPHQGVFAAATSAAVQLMPGFTPKGLVDVLWAYQSMLHQVPEPLLTAATAECVDRSSSGSSSSSSRDLGLIEFGPSNLSMLVWVCAKNKVMNTPLLSAINKAAETMLGRFLPQDLCKLLGGLAVLKSASNSLLDLAESNMVQLLQRAKSNKIEIQVVTQGVWAYAASNHEAGFRLVQILSQVAESNIKMLLRSGEVTSRLLSTLVLSRYRADGLISILAQTMLAAAAASGHGTAAAAGAKDAGSSTAAGNRPAAATAAAAAAINHLTRWDSRCLVAVAHSLARLGHTNESALLHLIVTEFVTRICPVSIKIPSSSSSSSEVSAAAAAVQHFTANLPKLPNSVITQCITLLWAAAVCDLRVDSTLLLLLAAAVRQAVGSALPYRSLAQLVQVHMWAKAQGRAGKRLSAALPQPLMKQALQFWTTELVYQTQHSSLHGEVLAELSSMRLRPTKEGVTPDGMFSIDCMVNFMGCEVALEVMGQEHYSSNKIQIQQQQQQQQEDEQVLSRGKVKERRYSKNSRSNIEQQQQRQDEGLAAAGAAEPQHVLLGPEVFRMKLLAARGYALATVSSFEWESVRSKGGARDLLLQKLQEAVQQHAAAAAAAGGRQQQQRRQLRHQQPGQGLAEDVQKVVDSSSGRRRLPSPRQQQQQQWGEVPDLAQQLSQVLGHKGRSAAVEKGKLRRQLYWERRKALKQQGRELLQLAAPYAAAKHARSGSSSGDAADQVAADDLEIGHRDLLRRTSSSSSSSSSSTEGWIRGDYPGKTSWVKHGSSSSNMGVVDPADSSTNDSEFDMALDLADLMPQQHDK